MFWFKCLLFIYMAFLFFLVDDFFGFFSWEGILDWDSMAILQIGGLLYCLIGIMLSPRFYILHGAIKNIHSNIYAVITTPSYATFNGYTWSYHEGSSQKSNICTIHDIDFENQIDGKSHNYGLWETGHSLAGFAHPGHSGLWFMGHGNVLYAHHNDERVYYSPYDTNFLMGQQCVGGFLQYKRIIAYTAIMFLLIYGVMNYIDDYVSKSYLAGASILIYAVSFKIFKEIHKRSLKKLIAKYINDPTLEIPNNQKKQRMLYLIENITLTVVFIFAVYLFINYHMPK